MPINGSAQRLTIYLGESDRWEGRPLYMALLETLRRAGLAGATVTRGIAGFGAHARIRTASLVDLSADLPMVVEVVDTPERIAGVMDTVSRMVNEGLITLEDVRVIKYTHRYLPSLSATQRVRDVMSTDVAVAQPDTALHEVVSLLLRRGVKAVPVVDADRRVVGIITGGDLLTRGGLPVRLGLQRDLPQALAEHHLRVLEESGKVARDIMTPDPSTITQETSVVDAASLMASRQLKRLPVVDGQGRLSGIISRIDILRAFTAAAHEAPAPPPPPKGLGLQVRDVMVTDVPTARPDTPLDEVLTQLVASPLRRVVITDVEGHVQGLITDAMLLAETLPEKRPGVWDTVRHRLGLGGPPPSDRAATRAVDVMTRDVYSIQADAWVLDAIAQMVERRVKRLVVLDADGRLLGMIGRQRALQAVAAEPGYKDDIT